MPTGDRNDPYRSFNFRVEIDGLTVGAFSEVSGLMSDGDAVDYREGTDLLSNVRKLPGLRKYGPITLKRGYTQNRELWTWYTNIVNGISDRRDGTIVLMDEAHRDVLRWDFSSGWINKIEAPSFKANGNEVALESVEIVHEGLKLV
ncbi:MAG: phage tail protein [Acidobacteria bacterium]|nr:MAG: phage tail protein [Acidobacteriota bacterium]PYS84956.1 MAG: phage tail protein [Acidobacteriota bacterium]